MIETVTSQDGAVVVIAVVADGAGSASQSERGAQRACERFLELMRAKVEPSSDLDLISDEEVRSWYAQVRGDLRLLCVDGGQLGDFSATSLLAIVSDHQGLCAQVGDGAIVVRPATDGAFDVALWPENGQYANETVFVTDARVTEHVGIRRYDRIEDVVLFSDGLQRLALEQASRTAFAPFFSVLLSTVRDPARSTAEIEKDLEAFLNSPRVNDKTDDDKSIVIACRMP